MDASQYGVGAVLLQNDQPIAYSSRTLTETQTRYAQIEKEALAIVHGCKRFHFFIYGHPKVTVETDHKPLEMIFNKPLNQVPLRLQQMRLTLQYYNFTVKYKPGRGIFSADCLSRQPLDEKIEEEITNHPIETIAISENRLEEYQQSTSTDKELPKLMECVKNGFPKDKRNLPDCIRPYWPYRDELHTESGLLLRSNRVIIPSTKRPEVLRQLHSSHCGISKMKNRARDAVYWPAMDTDIEAFAMGCVSCAGNANHKSP